MPQPGGRRCGVTPSASATSWPCAQVSISRAVAIDVGDIAVPNHGSLLVRRRRRSASASAARPARQRAQQLGRAAPGNSAAPRSTKLSGVVGRLPASVGVERRRRRWRRAARPRSVQARWAIWWATVQPGGRRGPGPVAGVERRDHGRRGRRTRRRGRSSRLGRASVTVSSARTVASWRFHAASSGARRAESSESRLATPSPRSRSSVACTASRTPGSALVGAEQLDGEAVHLPADVRLQRHERVAQLGIGAGGDPHLQRGDEQRAGERGGEHVDRPGRAGAGRRGSAAASARISARAPLGQVLDGGHHQGGLGRVVVQLGAAGDAGPLGDDRGGGAGPAVLDQALDGRLQQARPGWRGCAPAAGSARCARGMRARPETNSQACLFWCGLA